LRYALAAPSGREVLRAMKSERWAAIAREDAALLKALDEL
jgi:hypothetical protein